MSSQLFFSVMGLILVFEGIMPFLAPSLWKRMLQSIISQDEKSLRMMGFVLMIIGTILVCLMNSASGE